MSKPIVAIVGRENVGKSTLFNRIIGARHAIVEDTPGITRDRLYRDAEWLGRNFTLIDTGGVKFVSEDGPIAGKVRQQVELAIDEAEVIILVVDLSAGLVADDEEMADLLRRSNKPVVLAVNKTDNFNDEDKMLALYDFYALGLGEPLPVSAAQALNIGDLLDAVVALLPTRSLDDQEPDVIRLALIGRPNVGKSSLVNWLLGEERVIVTNQPGTTRDAIDTRLSHQGKEYLIIDTAGMRRKARINEPAEHYSVNRALNAVDRSDVCVLVIDAQDGLIEQDKHIAGYAHEAGKGLLIVVNKWDLPQKETNTMKNFEQDLREGLGFASYALTLFVSAKTGQRCNRILPLVDFIAEQCSRRVPTAQLNEVVREAVALNPPPLDKGKRLKIYYATQVGTNPPKIVFFMNEPESMHFSYARYLENRLREAFGFAGTPISLMWRKRERED